MRRALEEPETGTRRTEQRGVWTVTEQSAVTDRVLDFLAGADEEVVYMTVEELLTDDQVRPGGGAAPTAVEVRDGGPSRGSMRSTQSR